MKRDGPNRSISGQYASGLGLAPGAALAGSPHGQEPRSIAAGRGGPAKVPMLQRARALMPLALGGLLE